MTEPEYRRYWCGNGKIRNGVTPIHIDFAPQDSAGWAIAHTWVQLSWKLYLDNPSGGGDLHVWERRRSPEDDLVQQVEGQFPTWSTAPGASMCWSPSATS